MSRPTAWALDLPVGGAPVASGPRALVVADPESNLPAARGEGARVAGSLRAAGWAVDAFVGAAAGGASVRRALTEVSLFHYAGHGRAERDDPWAAYLALADGSRLSVRDLLALERGPRWVVLTGCRTGLVDPRAAAGGMGIAQAFLLMGAEGVLAATETVDDGLAGALGAAVASRLGAAGVDLPAAVHGAWAALGERPGWEDFRVWVR
ncbi:MAG: CHAT domain-containing protein [bacterium]